MLNPKSPKERGLLKGAIRRVFSRSELRREALKKNLIEHSDPKRPRVTKWAWCSECGEVSPAYKFEIDHRLPVVPLDKTLEQMTWDELVSNLWCSIDNLVPLCHTCHRRKSSVENKLRKEFHGKRKKHKKR